GWSLAVHARFAGSQEAGEVLGQARRLMQAERPPGGEQGRYRRLPAGPRPLARGGIGLPGG
ncbi:MAG TPA: hypothetical protein VF498_11840, partial [Anaerolineales bacterium]